MEKVIGITLNIKDRGEDGCKVLEVCKEISVKGICEECERTTLYPEENCGQPTVFVVCEEVV